MLDSWTWFLNLLINDLGDPVAYGYEFITDKQKGLEAAMDEVIPGVPRRCCARHISVNFTKNWRGLELKNLFWACAKATTPKQFDDAME
ncbi:hypothetical protein RIF29_15634 [Crotalaria pallida]|uniref:MULE transposase domain-containing protein n=1 Tax=Crotalaria pallida TaxID=3830 RepID=A0AAN9IEU0_CROPI